MELAYNDFPHMLHENFVCFVIMSWAVNNEQFSFEFKRSELHEIKNRTGEKFK